VIGGADRFGAVVLGPGLGRSPDGDTEIRRAVAGVAGALVVDGDGLSALGERAADILRARSTPAVLTPHDGEFTRLAGHPPGTDRFEDTRRLAAACRAVVLLKGPTTVVADPAGRVGVSLAGDARLATAGSGDVLSGIIGALLAQGLEPWRAALAGAELHGLAARHGPRRGLVAGDLPAALPAVWDDLP
jgi:NAD(P)H-hydrate epimerase